MGELTNRLLSAMNAHDLDAFVACFAEDYRSEQPAHPNREFRGRDKVRENWAGVFSGFPTSMRSSCRRPSRTKARRSASGVGAGRTPTAPRLPCGASPSWESQTTVLHGAAYTWRSSRRVARISTRWSGKPTVPLSSDTGARMLADVPGPLAGAALCPPECLAAVSSGSVRRTTRRLPTSRIPNRR